MIAIHQRRASLLSVMLRVIAVLAAVVFAASRAHADLGVIEVRPTARIAPGNPALLSDVAELSGEPALALATTVIREPSAGAMRFEITTADIRAALTQRHANWGRLTLRGTTCQVRVGERPKPRIETPERAEAEPATVDCSGPPTVRTRLARLIATMFNAENDDLRLRFEERDAELLNRLVTSETKVEIQPASTASSSRMAFVVWLYEGDSLEPTSQTVRVDVLLRKTVVAATREIRRGESIASGDLSEAVQWIAPDGSGSIGSAGQAIGMRAMRKIPAGAIVRTSSLEPPIACERGDLVKVHCISGAVVVKAWARALEKGLEGEFVELRLQGSEQTFRARLTGQRVAVMNLAG